MNIQLIGYSKCSTCKNAKKWLMNHNLSFEEREITLNTPTVSEIENWIKNNNIEIKKLFNTSGLKYKELNLKDKLNNMEEDEKIKLLSSNGMLIKRPILVINDKILIGFREKEWNNLL